ncbi:sensor histidine kinase [Macrococcoides caseolyticum]|uniref:sensor histidine kinase n=1 Tax=Macrococcoides caseolyticum TaxID=69966 RepID=UPI001F1A35C5|nr:HAMP domain-containing sensor histidine kinase [Macrococcus caseolyticus]MCE4957565.1 HAMP domain-containing histidine kinase [Macrococcus caseolyticus]
MNIGKKFILRFIRYFLIFYFSITAIICAFFVFFLSTTELDFYEEDLQVVDSITMSEYMNINGNKVLPHKKMLAYVKKNNGVIIVRNKDDKVIYTSEKDFKLRPLTQYRDEEFTTWEMPDGKQVVYVENGLLNEARQKIENGDKNAMKFLEAHHLGLFVAQQSHLKKLSGDFDEGVINNAIFEHKNHDHYQQYYFVSYKKDQKNYYIVQKNQYPEDAKAIFAENSYLYDKDFMVVIKSFLVWYAWLNVAVFLSILLLSFLIGSRLARPLRHFSRWVEQLANGDYTVLNNDKIYKDGRLRRKYRMYSSIDQAIAKLTGKLADDKHYQSKMNEQRENWVRGITHDLKTPLSSIYGYAKILNSDMPLNASEQKKFMAIIEDKALYIDELLKDLNMVYQLKSDGIQFHTEATCLKSYIESFVAQYGNKGLSYVYQENAMIHIDISRMDRVLTNIVSNSFTHNTNVEVWISTYLNGNNAIIEVADNGQGIPQEDLKNIFDQFYRGKQTNAHHNGSGLGLSVAKQIVELHEGTIDVISSVAGTKFLITLPAK